MSRLDEREIIRVLQKTWGNTGFTPEDVESFCINNEKIVVKADTLVQSTDMPPEMTVRDAARKSVIACVSDFAAKGAKPRYGIVSLNLPRGVSRQQVRHIAQGIRQASREFGIKFLGGDTNEGREFVFQVCVFGTAKKIVPRKGARPGELIFVSGPFGYAAAGLEILGKKRRAGSRFKLDAVRAFARPCPRLDFGLKNKRYFTSSMDSSDGLSVTLNEMARQSRCRFVIDSTPTYDGLVEFARLNRISAERLVFHGGEEYEFAFTVPKRHRAAVQKNAQLTGTPVFEIGCVEKGSGVFVKRNDMPVRLQDLGWDHFKK